MAHLYLMSRSDAPGALKVGRSDDPTRRAHELQSGHFFTMTVLARIDHAGQHERAVHAALQDRRIPGPGVEWFRCSLGEALVAIGRVLGGEEDDTKEAEEVEMVDAEETPSASSSPKDAPRLNRGYASRLRKELHSWTTRSGLPLTEEVARSHLAKLKAGALDLSRRFRTAELAWIAEVERALDAASSAVAPELEP